MSGPGGEGTIEDGAESLTLPVSSRSPVPGYQGDWCVLKKKTDSSIETMLCDPQVEVDHRKQLLAQVLLSEGGPASKTSNWATIVAQLRYCSAYRYEPPTGVE